MSSLNRVEMFVEVVRQGSFAAAAEQLGVSSPAISKQVSILEKELGVKLLYRTTRSHSLTEEGSLYFEKARKALEDLSEAELELQELKDCPTGKIKLNAPMSFGSAYLTEPLAKFAKQYPDVEMDIDFSDRWVDVISESYDLVVRIGALQDSSLMARRLADCPIFLCASPAFLEQHGPIESPDQIASLPAIVYTQHSNTEDWSYQSKAQSGKVRLKKVFSGNAAEMQVEACLKGVGVALLPCFTAQSYLDSGELIQVLPEYKTVPERGIYLVYPYNRQTSTRVKLLIEALVESASDFGW